MKKIYLVLLLSVAAGFVMSCSHDETKNTARSAMDVNVALPVVDSVLLESSYPGYLTAKQKVDVVARVSGYLRSVNFKAGDKVNKGQLLFVIEPSQYQEAVNQAEASLQSAISQKEYALNNYQATVEAAKSDAVSRIDLIKAESALNQAEAAINSAKAALETAKLNLSYCYVKAPVTGQITKQTIDVGNYLNGSVQAQTLATIYDETELYANFTIPDKMYMRMMAGSGQPNSSVDYNKVPVTFEENLKNNYYGLINYMSPDVELSTGTMEVTAIIKNPSGELKSGMYATIHLPLKMISEAILIKDASISTDQLGKYVYVVTDSNKVVYTPIVIGALYNDTMRVVNSGLKPTDRYVTKALLKVRNGMTVNPILTK